jgi:hypothetical protein
MKQRDLNTQIFNFLKEKSSDVIVTKILDVKAKDYGDIDGFIGGHYIVKCLVMALDYSSTANRNIEIESTCLVNIGSFRKWLIKKEAIIWI